MLFNDLFNRFAARISDLSGSAYAFTFACFIIIVWLISGPLMGFSDTWQLMINTFTTLVTFLMVFLIQNSQNREQDQFKKWLKTDVRNTKNVLSKLETIDKRTNKE